MAELVTKRTAVREGFTMVELMAILVIIGLLAAVVARNVLGNIDKAKVTSTKASLKVLHAAVTQFKLDTQRYPSQEAGLEELLNQPSDVMNYEPGGYLETTDLPKDGWKRDFLYELVPASGKPFVVYSLGADGQEGGEGYDADLYSTDAD